MPRPSSSCAGPPATACANATIRFICWVPAPALDLRFRQGKKYGITIALGSYLEGFQTNGLDGRYLYTRYFKGLADVLKTALDNAGKIVASAQSLDSKLDNAAVSDDQRFLISHATHSYYGSTQLLEVEGQPLWVVNEGEYCMMNTLDLAVDHVFWELEHNPWLVRNLLDDVCSPLQLHRRSESLQIRFRAFGRHGAGGSLSDPAAARRGTAQPPL